MTRYYKQLNTVLNTASPGLATLELDLTHAYESVHIPFTLNGVDATVAQMAAAFESISVIRNGKVQIRWTGAEWHKRCASWDSVNWAPRVGFFDFYFGLPKDFTLDAQLDALWGTVGVRDLHIEIKLAAGLVTPVFGTAHAWRWPFEIENRFIIRNLTTSENPAAGDHYMDNLSVEDGDYLAIHHTTTDVASFTTRVNDAPIIDGLTRSENGVFLARGGNFVQDAAWSSLFFVGTAHFSDRLGMFADGERIKLKHIPNMTAGVAHSVISEVYGPPIGR